MPIVLPILSYPSDALEPQVSARTLELHFHKHYKACVKRPNIALADSRIAG